MVDRFHFHRFEFKYLLDRNARDKMMHELSEHMELDIPYDQGEKYYDILNLYMDSSSLKFYREKIDGLMFRRKMRFRFYTANPDEKDNVFIEIKRKRNMAIIKDRVKLPYGEAFDIARGSYGGIMRKIDSFEGQSRDVLSEFIFEAIKNRLRSNLWVNYKRTAFQSKRYPSLRITFDDDVISIPADDGFSFNTSSLPRRLFKDASILEIKYNGTLPFWVHDIIQRYNLFREPISKYCNAVERLLL